MPLSRSRFRFARASFAAAIGTLVACGSLAAQVRDSLPAAGTLKRLSLEQLMNIEVTSVSRRPERLSETASAVQVITSEEIRRSGATSLPEVLRLATNLQVAQVNSSQWAITARGFNNVLANKLLVLIDGRTVYTPLYAGVFWDVQNPPLETIDRVEVVSGPGGTLWGANAVNGVINIITKPASDTHGLRAEAGGGSELNGFGEASYAGKLAPDLHGRVYAEAFDRGSTALLDGNDAKDSWYMLQGGFRADRERGSDLLTLQSDIYDGRPNPDGATEVAASGGDVLGRWTHTVSPSSSFQLQLYFDRTFRDFNNGFTEGLSTYDADWQHRFTLGGRNEIVWGAGARLRDHRTQNLELFLFDPAQKTLAILSAFVQDEITVVSDRLHLTVGTKVEHNTYTDWEVQPNARLAWNPASNHTIWAAVSRAVRTPSRLDRDFFLYIAPSLPFIAGSDFQSEKLVAYELGWRAQASDRLSASVSTFYNDYDDLQTTELGPPPLGIPVTFANGLEGHTYGVELAATAQLSRRWRLRGGYTFLKKKLELKPGSTDANAGTANSDDPEHQLLLQSTADISPGLELDGVVRYVDALPAPSVPSYITLDVRVGWEVTPHLELSVVGQNLFDSRHPEFVPSSPSPREIERGVYGKITWR